MSTSCLWLCCTLQARWPKGFQVMLLAPSRLSFGVLGLQMHTTTSDFFFKLFFTWVIGIELKFSGVVASTFYAPSHLHGPEFYFLVCLFLCVLLSGEGRWW